MVKERIVYYDCFVTESRSEHCPRALLSHTVLDYILKDKSRELVGIGIDRVNEHEIKGFQPLLSFYILQGMKDKVDKLIMPTIDVVGDYAAVVSLYKVLKKNGIKLEFFLEGNVDEKFIEIMNFMQEKEDRWRKYAYKTFIRDDRYYGTTYFMKLNNRELSIGNYINEMFSDQIFLFDLLEIK